MQTTKIIRRIDELGRVVVPKEMRKTMKIRAGDTLEIFTSDDTLVLKKFCPFALTKDTCDAVVDAIKKNTDCDVIIGNREKVVCSTKRDLVGHMMNRKVSELGFGEFVALSKEDGEIIQPIKDKELEFFSQMITPIFSDELLGHLIVYGKRNMTNSDVKVIKLSADILAKKLS